MPTKSLLRKIAESVLVVVAGVGLMAFGTFEDDATPFPPTSVAGP